MNTHNQPAEKRLSLSHDKIKIEERISQFFSAVNKDGIIMPHVPHLGKCWEWTKHGDKKGYGKFKWFGLASPTHRVSWMIHFGEFDELKWICHKCDNPSCVNPNHLFLGNAKSNSDDMIKKGRRYQVRGDECTGRRFPEKVTGSNNGMAKLNEVKVREIKIQLGKGFTAKSIAKNYGVCAACICNIRIGKRWRHVK